MNTKSGFTLLEILIVIGILGILAGIVIAPFSRFRNSKNLETSTENTLTVLAKARSNTLSSKNSYQYGVHFEASQIVLFRGTTYNVADTSNEVTQLDTTIEISNISLAGGGVNIIFDRLTGKTSQSGTVTLRVKSDVLYTRTVTIEVTGVSSAN